MTTPQSVEEIVEEFANKFAVNISDIKATKQNAKNWLRTNLTTTRQQAYEEGVKAERERIVKEYGHFNDGCGCCSEEKLCDALNDQ